MTIPWVGCHRLIKNDVTFCFLNWFAKHFQSLNLLDLSLMNQLHLFYLFFLCRPLVLEPNGTKENTHVHTTLCGHADSTPEFVAQWYHDRGYHFLVLGEHNKFIDPSTVKLKGEIRDDFLLLPGKEVTGPVHSTAMNISRLVPWNLKTRIVRKIIQIMWMKPEKQVG